MNGNQIWLPKYTQETTVVLLDIMPQYFEAFEQDLRVLGQEMIGLNVIRRYRVADGKYSCRQSRDGLVSPICSLRCAVKGEHLQWVKLPPGNYRPSR